MTLSRKFLPFIDAKATGAADSTGSVEGYASTFGNIDSYGDQIAPGAYKQTIDSFLKDGFIAWSHDWAMPIAIPTSAKEDSKGLFITADYHSDSVSQRARTVVAERLERGKSMGLSIGYEPVAWETRKVDEPVPTIWGGFTDEIRILKEIKLYEVSLVTMPADEAARVTDAKGSLPYSEEAEEALAAVHAYLARTRSLADLRRKEGRVLSEANRARLRSVQDALAGLESVRSEIEALLAATEPAKAVAKLPELAALVANFETMKTIYGLTISPRA